MKMGGGRGGIQPTWVPFGSTVATWGKHRFYEALRARDLPHGSHVGPIWAADSPDSPYGYHVGPIWVIWAPDSSCGPHVGPIVGFLGPRQPSNSQVGPIWDPDCVFAGQVARMPSASSPPLPVGRQSDCKRGVWNQLRPSLLKPAATFLLTVFKFLNFKIKNKINGWSYITIKTCFQRRILRGIQKYPF